MPHFLYTLSKNALLKALLSSLSLSLSLSCAGDDGRKTTGEEEEEA